MVFLEGWIFQENRSLSTYTWKLEKSDQPSNQPKLESDQRGNHTVNNRKIAEGIREIIKQFSKVWLD